jgi:hypothetical protein
MQGDGYMPKQELAREKLKNELGFG